MEVYVVRHTTPAVSPGFIYGRTEVGLMDSFLSEVERIKGKLPTRLDAVYSSPSSRCVQLTEQLTPDFMVDDRLFEFNFGDWEGKTWDNIDPQESAAWMHDFVHVAAHNGESMAQMNERVSHFWDELGQKSHETVGVVTHGGVIRLLLAREQQRPLASVFEIKVDYGDVFVFHPR